MLFNQMDRLRVLCASLKEDLKSFGNNVDATELSMLLRKIAMMLKYSLSPIHLQVSPYLWIR